MIKKKSLLNPKESRKGEKRGIKILDKYKVHTKKVDLMKKFSIIMLSVNCSKYSK